MSEPQFQGFETIALAAYRLGVKHARAGTVMGEGTCTCGQVDDKGATQVCAEHHNEETTDE